MDAHRRLCQVAGHVQQTPAGSAPASSAPAQAAAAQSSHKFDRAFQYIEVDDDVTLRVVVEGPPDAPLVVFLHGFPQGWFLWRNQIDPFVAAVSTQAVPLLVILGSISRDCSWLQGYRVAVPDQRGYGGSSQPKDVALYDVRLLARDIVRLGAALGSEKFFLVTHDWGCVLGWNIISLYPENIKAIIGLDVPYSRPGLDVRTQAIYTSTVACDLVGLFSIKLQIHCV